MERTGPKRTTVAASEKKASSCACGSPPSQWSMADDAAEAKSRKTTTQPQPTMKLPALVTK